MRWPKVAYARCGLEKDLVSLLYSNAFVYLGRILPIRRPAGGHSMEELEVNHVAEIQEKLTGDVYKRQTLMCAHRRAGGRYDDGGGAIGRKIRASRARGSMAHRLGQCRRARAVQGPPRGEIHLSLSRHVRARRILQVDQRAREDASDDAHAVRPSSPSGVLLVFRSRPTRSPGSKSIHRQRAQDVYKRQTLTFGTVILPNLEQDNTDRNRTSPFAFTNNKFEFRAVGSEANVSDANTVLDTAVAESLRDFADALEGTPEDEFQEAALAYCAEHLRAHRRILFSGDGYSEAWEREAEARDVYKRQRSCWPWIRPTRTRRQPPRATRPCRRTSAAARAPRRTRRDSWRSCRHGGCSPRPSCLPARRRRSRGRGQSRGSARGRCYTRIR